MKSTSLHFRDGRSDKVYHVAVDARGAGHVVTFAYGRRGQTLTTGTKTPEPVSLAAAERIHDQLVASKLAKGYRPSDESATPYRQTGEEGRDTGIRCQLLNPIDEAELDRLVAGRSHCLQEKHDGRRLLVRKVGEKVTGINRRGLVVAIPKPVRRAVEELPMDALVDGEVVGEVLHAFDLLEAGGHDLRERRYLDRFAGLLAMIPFDGTALRTTRTFFEPADKEDFLDGLRRNNREGVVLKDVAAPYSAGRPASGGTQLKYKFVESASFVVLARNAKRSVTLGLLAPDGWVTAGNVAIPPNHPLPAEGDAVEVRYLHAFRESGAIYQPVFLGVRDDVPADECTTAQLKYKAAEVAA